MAITTYTIPAEKIVHNTSVDFSSRFSIINPIHIVQYDNSLPIISVELKNDNKTYILPTNIEVWIRWKKPDNTFVRKQALGCNVERNTVYFEITQQMVMQYGSFKPVVELIIPSNSSNPSVASSGYFSVLVDRNPIQNGDIESMTEYEDPYGNVYYTKTVIDNMIVKKADKSIVDSKLAVKADLIQSKNIFDFDKWAKLLQKSPYPISKNGTLDNIDFEEKSITFTSIANDSFTNNWQSNSIFKYAIDVKPKTTYTLSWQQIGASGRCFVFLNGISTTGYTGNIISTLGINTFTTKEDTSYITLRFGITNPGSATVSKIMLEEGDKKSLYLPYKVAEGVKELAKSTDKIKEDVDKLNSGGLIIKDDVIKDDINNWLNEHPEATTTVQDGTITEMKLETKLLSKLSYVTPQMYGAKADGINDDTESIQKAINSGKAVYIPAGTYKLNKIVILNTCKIYGDGVDKTILKINYFQGESETAKYGIEIGNETKSADNCVLRDFTVIGRKGDTALTNDKIYGGIRLYKTTGSVIENIKVRSCGSHGMQILSGALDCKLSNITAMYNKIDGIAQEGFGNSIVNSQCSQNERHGMHIGVGGFQATNVKSWGNRGHGFNISGTNALIVQLSNCEAQQNGKDGLHLGNGCSGCVITGYQGLANNYIGSAYIASTPIKNGCGITVGGHNNYIQGSIISGYENGEWNAMEAASIKIEESDTYANVVDVFVTDTRKLTDRYNLYFNDKYEQYQFCENKLLSNINANPLNSIKINGCEMIDKSMTALPVLDDVANGLDVTKSTSNDILSITFSNYSGIVPKTLDNLSYKNSQGVNIIDGTDGKNVVVPYLRRYYFTVPTENQSKSLYIKLTAKTSKFRSFGLFLNVQIETKDGKYVYVFNKSEEVKNTCVFSSEYVDRYIYVDLSEVSGNIKAIRPGLRATKLTNDCDETTTIDIKEFSYKLC